MQELLFKPVCDEDATSRLMFSGTPFSSSAVHVLAENGERQERGAALPNMSFGDPLAGFLKSLGGALKLPGLAHDDQSYTEHDSYGFRRNPRHAISETMWEAVHAKNEARQEILWASRDRNLRDMQLYVGDSFGLNRLVFCRHRSSPW